MPFYRNSFYLKYAYFSTFFLKNIPELLLFILVSDNYYSTLNKNKVLEETVNGINSDFQSFFPF